MCLWSRFNLTRFVPCLYQAAHAPPVTKSKAGWTSGALEEALLEGPALMLVVEKENAASRLSMLFRGGGASSRGFRAGGGAAQAGPIARYSPFPRSTCTARAPSDPSICGLAQCGSRIPGDDLRLYQFKERGGRHHAALRRTARLVGVACLMNASRGFVHFTAALFAFPSSPSM